MECRLNIYLNLETGDYTSWLISKDGGTPPQRRLENELGERFFGYECLEFNIDTVYELRNTLILEFDSDSPFRDAFSWVKHIDDIQDRNNCFKSLL